MPSKLTLALAEANREIAGMVTRLSENRARNPGLRPGEMRALHRELARVGKQLSSPSLRRPQDAGLEAAIREYVGNLEALRGALGKIQEALTHRRERVKKEFAHMHSARAWMQTYRNISR